MITSQIKRLYCNLTSAVIRFCKSIQLQGFSELKIELARELGSQREEKKSALPSVEHESGIEGVVRKVFSAGTQTLQDTLIKIRNDILEGIRY